MCAAPTNFLQWNPSLINQQTDGTYATDAQRVGGAVTGIFPSDLANKLYYQTSTLVTALATAMVNKGYEMQDTSLADLITSLSNILTKAEFGTGVNTVCQGNDDRLNVSGTKMWFYQNVAPTGWTIDATVADAVLAVKGGSNAYYVAGGTQSGTWTQAAHIHTVSDHTHTSGSHTHTFTGSSHQHTTGDVTLTAAQSGLPSHNHSGWDSGGGGNLGLAAWVYYQPTATVGYNVAQNASQAHNHGLTSSVAASGTISTPSASSTGASGAGNTGASATANTWRPLAQVGIICTKN